MPKIDSAGRKLLPESLSKTLLRVVPDGDPKVGGADSLKPFWQSADNETVRYYLGDVCDVLARLPERSVHCVVTSPPYWGLRDYGTGTWEGGDLRCDHTRPPGGGMVKGSGLAGPGNRDGYSSDGQFKEKCGKCGAKRIDQQLGSEPSPDCLTSGQAQCGRCFVCSMVRVFREVRRVLRDDGTLWLNLGDTMGGGKVGRTDLTRNNVDGFTGSANGADFKKIGKSPLPAGNLVGVPWRVALALQADGWVLRQDIIWSKPSPMPESVRNRCTKAHEYVFLLTKSAKYYYDAEAIKENKGELRIRSATPNEKLEARTKAGSAYTQSTTERNGFGRDIVTDGRNKRSVWPVRHERALLDWLLLNYEDVFHKYLLDCHQKGDVWRVASFGYPGAHFATFPPKLIEPCVLAGTSEYGCCAGCGAPWQRVVAETKLTRERPNEYVKRSGVAGTGNSCANTVAGVETRTVGWEPTCTCNGQFEMEFRSVRTADAIGMPGNSAATKKGGSVAGASEYFDRSLVSENVKKTTVRYVSDLPLDEHPVVPCVVLDPFIGSGTTAEVCVEHGRRCWGIDLSAQYLEKNAVPRAQGALLARPATAWLAGGVPSGPGEVDGAADLAEEP